MAIDPHIFKQRMQIRWADIDANFHMRHSVYYELCAQMRMDVLSELGWNMAKMKETGILPIIFREECKFFKEINHQDEIWVDCSLSKLSKDYRKFSFKHSFSRGADTCAISEVDLAWLDHSIRKITVPPNAALEVLDAIPRSDDFMWL
jgi:acyl-CoA thioester hydrolase